jgi:hypothetical protein
VTETTRLRRQLAGYRRRFASIHRHVGNARACLCDPTHREGDERDADRALARAQRSIPKDLA